MQLLIFAIIGTLAGVLSGFLGIGGGLIIVPALFFVSGFSQHLAQGTSLAALLLPIGIFAFHQYHKNGNTNIEAAAIIVIFFMISSYFAAKYAQDITESTLKRMFAMFLFCMSLVYFYKSK
jgi:hypothetical protein